MEKIIEATISIFSISAIRYFTFAGIPFVLFYLLMPAKLGKFKIQQKPATKKDIIREVWHSMQSTLVFSIIAVALVFTPLHQYTRIYAHINDFPIWYIGVALVLSLIIHDTYFY